ncbi:Alpha/Beta hydrolase protein [Aspergillus pseudoustus]|uniref:Alpha/Beta hydrolase protein n=1 Tax=Aspergillus pseudoustus TaxID=1810923 RepID=A0ABR4JK78_9EURO
MTVCPRIQLRFNIQAVRRLHTEAPRTNQTLSLDDGRILGFAEYGSPTGFPLLYFHGFPSSRLEASDIDANARRRSLRLIAPERPGFGLSTFKPNQRITEWPNDVLSLADHLRIPRFAVLGGSGGSAYALACALALPHERLSAVGILAGTAPWDGVYQHVSRLRRLLSWAAMSHPTALRILFSLYIGVARWDSRTSPARWLDAWEKRQASVEKGEQVFSTRRILEASIATEFGAFAQGSAATVQEARLLSQDWGFRLEDVGYDRIQIWHGEKDTNVPIEMVRSMAARLPHADLREYEGESHFTLSEHIDEILDELVPESLIQLHVKENM